VEAERIKQYNTQKIEIMENEKKYPNLPTPKFIENQTTCIGCQVIIIGLTKIQAKEIVCFAQDKNIKGSMCFPPKSPLTDFEKGKLSNRFYVPEDSVEVYLGESIKSHEPLFKLLGLKI